MTQAHGPPRLRAFVAFEIEAAARERLGAAGMQLKPKLAGVRWVATAGLHVTLRFLGPSAPEALARLTPALRAAAAACPAFEARLGPLGLFPERGSPRTLWLAASVTPEALTLQEACERAAVAAGFAPESRAFKAHLTLGRWRERVSRPSLPERDWGASRIDRLVVFRSELRSTGAVYAPLAVFGLG